MKTSHLAPARFSKISFGLTETHPTGVDGVHSICRTNMGTVSVGGSGLLRLAGRTYGVRVPKQREVSRAVGTSHAGTLFLRL